MTPLLTILNPLELALVAVLVIGATLRLTRLATTDSLGGWLLRNPLGKWAARHERARRMAMRKVIDLTDVTDPEMEMETLHLLNAWEEQLADTESWISWQGRLVSGLFCPFCVGFWIGLGVLATTVLLFPLGAVWSWWLVLLAGLGLNYLVGHVSAKID